MIDDRIRLADMKNMGKPGNGGMIAAALILQRFTDGTSVAHIDIAGPGDRTPTVAIRPRRDRVSAYNDRRISQGRKRPRLASDGRTRDRDWGFTTRERKADVRRCVGPTRKTVAEEVFVVNASPTKNLLL